MDEKDNARQEPEENEPSSPENDERKVQRWAPPPDEADPWAPPDARRRAPSDTDRSGPEDDADNLLWAPPESPEDEL